MSANRESDRVYSGSDDFTGMYVYVCMYVYMCMHVCEICACVRGVLHGCESRE